MYEYFEAKKEGVIAAFKESVWEYHRLLIWVMFKSLKEMTSRYLPGKG
jgi:hypothetical protein